MPRKKPKPAKSWAEHEANRWRTAFETNAADFIHIMKQGGGIENVLILDTIRGLELSYLMLEAYRRVADATKKG